jgi:hypothetical protein
MRSPFLIAEISIPSKQFQILFVPNAGITRNPKIIPKANATTVIPVFSGN